jgi:hypothetical protein
MRACLDRSLERSALTRRLELHQKRKGAKKQICFIGRLREGRLSSLIGRQAMSYEKERDVTGVLSLWGWTRR